MTIHKQKRSVSGRDRVKDATAKLIAQNGIPPTISEIAMVLGLSTATVFWHLASLKKAGVLTWEARRARTIRFIAPTSAERSA